MSKLVVGNFVKVGDIFIEISKIKNANTGNVKLANGDSHTINDESEVITAEQYALLAGTETGAGTNEGGSTELPEVDEVSELRKKLSESEAKNASLQKMYSELEGKYNTVLGDKMKLQMGQPVVKKVEPVKIVVKATGHDCL
jgi:hypothetical protein